MIKDIKKNLLVVRYVFKYCPLYALFTLIYIAIDAFLSIQKVLLIGKAVSLVETLIKSSTVEYKDLIKIIVIYIVIVIVCTIYTTIYNSYIKGYYRINYIRNMRRL